MRKRMKAICGPGRRADAAFVASAITANVRAAAISAATAGGLRKETARGGCGYFFFFGLVAPAGFAVAVLPAGLAAGAVLAAASPAAALRCHKPSTLPSGSANNPISPPPANGR